MLTVGSLFSGIGGLDYGLERAGMDVRWQCELELFNRRILRQHWPMAHIFPNINTLLSDPKFIKLPPVDLICGGDPCQENSNARTTHHCTAPSMGAEFIGIVRSLRPQFVLRENPSAVRKDAPWPWWRFRSELEKIGYGVVPFRLRSCCLGGEHRRDRLWLFAALPNPHENQQQGWCGVDSRGEKSKRPWTTAQRYPRRSAPPRILRSAHELTNSVDRIKALGNAVDAAQSYWIGQKIVEWHRQTYGEQ